MTSSSNPDRFRRAQDLFHRAASLDVDARGDFLREACRGEDSLRSEVEDLLERDGRPSVVSGEVALAVEGALGVPDRVGPYRIMELLGRGGMGVVYRARQEDPDRDVALKLLRPTLFSGSNHARLQNESHVLARLQHPGIAQVFEAGTVDFGFGEQPWFAMEVVEGQQLSRWAESKSLGEKLGLVIRLCEAVEHAHRRGVVHRDLKPDNVLVTGDGNPKVLDFGVARVMGAERMTSLRTGVQSLVGTLPYMSPEQAQGETERIDPRADVYSLGVVTYELLAGVLPLDLREKPLAQAVRVIVEDEPKPLSSCHRAFRGDLDTILRKALEKEPERRYASAAELASDLERFLRDEPVRARPPTTWYQLSKLAKRNRRLFAAIAVAFVALVAGTVTSTALAVRASRARDEARDEATRSAKVVQLALGLLSPNEMTKSDPSPVVLLDHATARVQEQLGDQPDLAGDFFLMIGQLLWTLDHVDKAEAVLERAVVEHRKVADAFPEKLERSLTAIQRIAGGARDAQTRAGLWGEIAELRARLHGDAAPETLNARFLHASLVGMAGELDRSCELLRTLRAKYGNSMTPEQLKEVGASFYRNGIFREAEGALRRALDELPDPTETYADCYAGFWMTFQLTGLYSDVGDLARADEVSQRIAVFADGIARFGYSEANTIEPFGLYMRAHVLHSLGRDVEAEELARESVSIVERIRRTKIAFPWRELGLALLGQGRLLEAEDALREYLERQSAQTGDAAWYVAQAESLLAGALRERGKLDEALELGRAGLERVRGSLRPYHPRVADALEPLARTLVELGRFDEAEVLCLEAIDIRERCMDPGALPVASVRLLLALIHAGRGEDARANELAEAAHAQMLERLPAGHPELGRALHVVASCAASRGLPEAEQRWRSAVEFRERVLGAGHPDTERSRAALGFFLLQQGRRDEAAPLLEESVVALAESLDPEHPTLVRARAALTGSSSVEVGGR